MTNLTINQRAAMTKPTRGSRSTSGIGVYNGFTGVERIRKLQEMHRQFPEKTHPYYKGACHLCTDPDSPVAPHDEDYSQPYVWTAPAVRALCNRCHSRIHRRFTFPHSWQAYMQHVRRGGYGSDLVRTEVAREIAELTDAIRSGKQVALSSVRESSPRDRWWEKLSTTHVASNAS